jgi:translation initiation factor 5A
MKEQTEVGKLKEGRYVVIEEEPCKILGIATSKPGKHGAAKARVDAVGLFDGVKRSIVSPVSGKIYVPMVERKGAQVISKAGRVIQLMDTKDFTMFELTVSEEEAARIETGTDITYIESMGTRKLD